jgi:hypothetical protein
VNRNLPNLPYYTERPFLHRHGNLYYLSYAWGIIKGFYEGKRPHTCLKCTFYQPINQHWFEERAKGNGMNS